MNKQDKTLGKALDIALSLGSIKPTLDRCVETGIQMASWKEQQMIEKAVEWINIHMLYNASESYKKEIIENFKNYMQDEIQN